MYELIILWLLMQMPVHGFLIVKIINDMIGPVARASNSNIYPLLNRLAAGGQVEVFEEKTSENGLPMKVYRITESGRERFHELLLDVTSHARDYREIFPIKVLAFTFLNPEERLHLIEHYIEFCRKHIQHFAAEAADYRERVVTAPTHASIVADVLGGMQLYQSRWELELAWAQSLKEREANRAL
ncbi:MAG TPA: PadR family transcriptional regulator [Symbiobacteriaceae bacterium]|nr:PadR family transcriptional regulator [Symbiobacteriaceae bacterium]